MTALRKFNDQESDSWRGNVLSLCGTRFGTECQECVYVGWGGGGGRGGFSLFNSGLYKESK